LALSLFGSRDDTANGLNTIDVLNTLKAEFPFDPMTLIWDGAPYHRSHLVKDAAAALDIKVEPLPGYSPDFMPVEHMQAVVTLRCYVQQIAGN
jgi:transposase